MWGFVSTFHMRDTKDLFCSLFDLSSHMTSGIGGCSSFSKFLQGRIDWDGEELSLIFYTCGSSGSVT